MNNLPQSVYPSRFQTQRQRGVLENPQPRTVSTPQICLGDKERSHRAVLAGGPSFLKPVAFLLVALVRILTSAVNRLGCRRGQRKRRVWDWPVNNTAPSCQPNPANEFCLTVPRVAVWCRPSGLWGQRGCEVPPALPLMRATRFPIDGRGKFSSSSYFLFFLSNPSNPDKRAVPLVSPSLSFTTCCQWTSPPPPPVAQDTISFCSSSCMYSLAVVDAKTCHKMTNVTLSPASCIIQSDKSG